jgi:hypothetical protein
MSVKCEHGCNKTREPNDPGRVVGTGVGTMDKMQMVDKLMECDVKYWLNRQTKGAKINKCGNVVQYGPHVYICDYTYIVGRCTENMDYQRMEKKLWVMSHLTIDEPTTDNNSQKGTLGATKEIYYKSLISDDGAEFVRVNIR